MLTQIEVVITLRVHIDILTLSPNPLKPSSPSSFIVTIIRIHFGSKQKSFLILEGLHLATVFWNLTSI